METRVAAQALYRFSARPVTAVSTELMQADWSFGPVEVLWGCYDQNTKTQGYPLTDDRWGEARGGWGGGALFSRRHLQSTIDNVIESR